MSQPAFKSAPSGRTRVRKYTVWSLDVWGHGSDECTDHDCRPCVTRPTTCPDCEHEGPHEENDDGSVLCCVACGTHFDVSELPREHDDDKCQCHWEVNDRSRCGEVEVTETGTLFNVGTPQQFESFSATDTEIIEALLPEYLRGSAENFEIDDPSCDGFSMYVQLVSGEPLLQLESEDE